MKYCIKQNDLKTHSNNPFGLKISALLLVVFSLHFLVGNPSVCLRYYIKGDSNEKLFIFLSGLLLFIAKFNLSANILQGIIIFKESLITRMRLLGFTTLLLNRL